MISLKKYLDMRFEPMRPGQQESNGLAEAALTSYRTALLDMGRSSYRACPRLGLGLQQSLTSIEKKLAAQPNAGLLLESREEVSNQLSLWGERTAEHFKEKAEEVKDLLMVVARTAECLGERDQRYAARLQQFSTHLRAVANFDDLTQLRSSLLQTAGELKTCVDQMERDSRRAISQLQSKVSSYENKLKETEDLALRDTLTGLANRLCVERRIQWRMENERPFCLVFLDLNGFKAVNDQYGHQAGDSLLKQFSEELRSNLRPGDLAGRWGGDEFVILMDCDLAGAHALIERLRQWVFGNYRIPCNRGKSITAVRVTASIGISEWKPGESIEHLVERADKAMYVEKMQSPEVDTTDLAAADS